MATFRLGFPFVSSVSVLSILGLFLPVTSSHLAKTANLPAMASFFGLIFSSLGRILAHLGLILDRLGHLLDAILDSILATRTFLDPYKGHI